MDLASLKTSDNQEANRFELKLDHALAFIEYKVGKSGEMYLVHTEVPNEYGGKGVGHKLVRESMDIIEKNDLRIIPLCPFVRSFLKDHLTDYENLLSERAKL